MQSTARQRKFASIVTIQKLSLAWMEILWSPGVLKPRIQGLSYSLAVPTPRAEHQWPRHNGTSVDVAISAEEASRISQMLPFVPRQRNSCSHELLCSHGYTYWSSCIRMAATIGIVATEPTHSTLAIAHAIPLNLFSLADCSHS